MNGQWLVDALYEDFILRDLFAKIAPGVGLLAVGLYKSEVVSLGELNEWPQVVVLAGIAWILGFAIQRVGEFASIIRHHPPRYADDQYRYDQRIRFKKKATVGELKRVERYAIIKEACGNGATAIFLGLVLLTIRGLVSGEIAIGIRRIFSGDLDWLATFDMEAALLVIAFLALVSANRRHAQKQYGFMERVLATGLSTSLSAVALDFDGVIVDSMPLQEQVWREALSRSVPPPEPMAVERVVQNLWAGHSGERIFEDAGLDDVQRLQAREEKDRLWNSRYATTSLVDGVRTALRRLSDSVPVFVATSAPRIHVETILTREGLTDFISGVFTDEDVTKPKPDPEMLHRIADEVGASSDSLTLVGDSPTDLQMARAGGWEVAILDIHSRLRHQDVDALVLRSWSEIQRALLLNHHS